MQALASDLSGSFNPCSLIRYYLLAGQLRSLAGGFLSENCVVTKKIAEHKTKK